MGKTRGRPRKYEDQLVEAAQHIAEARISISAAIKALGVSSDIRRYNRKLKEQASDQGNG